MTEGTFLARLPDPIRTLLQTSGWTVDFAPGALIFDVRDQDWAGIVTAGIAQIFSEDDSGRVLTHRNVAGGGVIGLAALIGARNAVGAQAVISTTVHQFDQAVLRRLRAADASFNLAAAHEIHDRLIDTSTEVSLRLRGNFAKRLSLELLDLVAKAGLGDARRISVTHEALADSLGTSREVVTRHLNHLSGRRLVRQAGRGQIELLDPEGLLRLGHAPELALT